MLGLCFGLAVKARRDICGHTVRSAVRWTRICMEHFKRPVFFTRTDKRRGPSNALSDTYHELLDACPLRMSQP